MKENTPRNRIELLFSLQTKLLSLNKIESSAHDSFCFDFDYILKPPGLADEPKYLLPERIYNPITAMGFSAMFTFQLDNTKR